MSWNVLSGQLFNLINDNKGTLNIQEVYGYPRLKFSGYPAVSLFPSDNSNDYETTTENLREYVWRLRVFYDTKSPGEGLEEAHDALKVVFDALLDLIDQENMDNNYIGSGLPARYTFINIMGVPGLWGETIDENLLFAEMAVMIRVSIDVS